MSVSACQLLFGAVDPEGLAVECGPVHFTRAQLTQRSLSFATLLRDADIQADDHVALLCRNRAEVLEVVLGSLLAGVWLTPVNWHLAAAEIGFVLRDSGAKRVVVDEVGEEVSVIVESNARWCPRAWPRCSSGPSTSKRSRRPKRCRSTSPRRLAAP